MRKIEELRNREEYSMSNLMELLKSEDENVRKEAENILALKNKDFSKIKELRERGDKGIPELLKFLDNKDKEVQWDAEYALEKMGREYAEKESARKLRKSLDDKEKSVQIVAALALEQAGTMNVKNIKLTKSLHKIDKKVSHKLKKLLDDDNWFVRKEVVDILGRIARYYPKKVKKASHKLMNLLDDEKEIVQAYAIDALGGIAKEYPEEVDISYFHKLPEFLNSNDVNIRYRTVSAIDKIAETHPEKVMNTSNKLIGLLRNGKGDIMATSALEKIAKANPKIAENISKELEELLKDENIDKNIVNKEEIARTIEHIANETEEEKKKENKVPFGLDMVLLFSAFFGLLAFVYGINTFQFANTLFELDPTLFIINSGLSLTGFLLILSAVGLWLQKKVAYWGLIFGWIPIMFFGLYYIYHVIEVGPGSALRPIATAVGFILFGLLPITIIFYMLAEKKKIENWVEIRSSYQFEKLVAILSAFLVSFGVIFLSALTGIWTTVIGFFITILIVYFISVIVYNVLADSLIKRKSSIG